MKRKALIVDDQADLRRLIMTIMEHGDFDLHEAENGEDAWRIAQGLRPDVVVLDVMMPGEMDGYQVCAKIKADPALQSITKVILLTARDQHTDIERGYAAGCDTYLVKPFSPLELLDIVDRLVEQT